jgi:hypothetical protein
MRSALTDAVTFVALMTAFVHLPNSSDAALSVADHDATQKKKSEMIG